jgi:AcrR family transcriptional regulator
VNPADVDTTGVRGRPPKDERAPRGPDQVRRATLSAATELFARRGVAAVSVREVAATAGVNPSLVHRYVGGKDQLLAAVLADLVEQLASDLPLYEEVADEPLPGRFTYLLATHQRIVAHLVMEGHAIEDYQVDFPVLDHLIAELQRVNGIDAPSARVRASVISAHELAVRLLMPLLLHMAGLDDDDADDLRQAVRQVNLRLSLDTDPVD